MAARPVGGVAGGCVGQVEASGTTTTSPVSCPGGGDDGEHRGRSAKLLGTVLHLQKGTPYVYEGEEIGMTNAPFATIDDLRDIESVNYYRSVVDEHGASPEEVMVGIPKMSRDNARTPMQWDALLQAASSSSATPSRRSGTGASRCCCRTTPTCTRTYEVGRGPTCWCSPTSRGGERGAAR